MDENREISLDDAREIDARYEIGDAIEFAVTPEDFGRIAAQTAKQVVVQRIREAERSKVYDEFQESSIMRLLQVLCTEERSNTLC